MTNHYHLLIETPNANLSRGMRQLNGIYTQVTNRRHDRTGHLLQRRFKSILVEKESHLLELARYVVLNPVRAKMVRSPRDWKWSSYRATAGQVDPPEFLSIDWILSQFDDDPARAVHAYRRFTGQGRGVCVWDDLRGGSLLGTEAFIEELKPRLKTRATSIEVPRKERLAGRPSLDELFANVEDKMSRNEQIYQAVRVHEYKLKEVSDFLGLYYSTISVIAKRVAQVKQTPRMKT